jgi:exodeoxyribonuclease V beta subunit
MAASLFDLQTTSIDGVNLIEASAGTGKTFTIEGLYLRLLLEKRIKVENILVVTFTEAATAELRERIGDKIRSAEAAFRQQGSRDGLLGALLEKSRNPQQDQDRLQVALATFDEAPIHTIHGFCLKMLNDFALESGSLFEAEFLTDQRRLLEEVSADYWRKQVYGSERNFVELFLQNFQGPQRLADLAAKTVSRPVLHILPKLGGADSPRTLYSRLVVLYKAMESHWAAAKNEICSLIIGNQHWTRQGKYRDKIPGMLQDLTIFFEEEGHFSKHGVLEQFTPEVMRRKTTKAGRPPDHPLFADFAKFAELMARLNLAMTLDFVMYAREEMKSRKQRRNVRSYDDLLQDLHQAVTGRHGGKLAAKIRGRFAAVLVDEFQDTDPVQYDIFRILFMGRKNSLFLIGDPKQSIYNFRGADIYAYLKAENDIERKYTLGTNYRSDRDLITAVNTLFTCRDRAFVDRRISFPPTAGAEQNPARSFLIDNTPQSPLQFWFREAPSGGDRVESARLQITEAVAGRIAQLLNLGTARRARFVTSAGETNLQPKDIAVLVRTHKEAGMIQAALARRRVASVLNVNKSIFDSQEFHDLRLIAGAIADYRRESKVRGALLTEVMGFSGTRLHQWSRDEKRWEEVLDSFRRYHEVWAATGFYQMMRMFLHQEQVRSSLLAKPDGERRLTNVLHVLELFHLAESAWQYSMTGLLAWAERIPSDGAEQDEYQIRLETDSDTVKILTVHASKGLEFPLVFIPFSWGGRDVGDSLFHDPANNDALTWDLEKREENRRHARNEALAENLRLLYVALTRAKHHCCVAWGDIPRTADSCFAYLFHGAGENDRWSDLQRLQDASMGNIDLIRLPAPDDEVFVPPQSLATSLACRQFHQSLRQDFGISSFSGLSARKMDQDEGMDHDQLQVMPAVPEDRLPGVAHNSIFAFPAGTRTGECFHEIFENLDFTERDQKKITALVREKLVKFNFDPAWTAVGGRLVQNVLQREIIPHCPGAEAFSFAQIAPELIVKEMAFHFPIVELDSRFLRKRVAAHCRNASHNGLLHALDRLEFTTLQGFMKGFIDLVFCHKERFYIVDWKTNNLGDRPEDYASQGLQQAMASHIYILQYYIYAVALNRYLRFRLGDTYHFERHFGGVFYVFLRGIDALDATTGVFHDSLHDSEKMIDLLGKVFGGEK